MKIVLKWNTGEAFHKEILAFLEETTSGTRYSILSHFHDRLGIL